jgi:hypothetical protein
MWSINISPSERREFMRTIFNNSFRYDSTGVT